MTIIVTITAMAMEEEVVEVEPSGEEPEARMCKKWKSKMNG